MSQRSHKSEMEWTTSLKAALLRYSLCYTVYQTLRSVWRQTIPAAPRWPTLCKPGKDGKDSHTRSKCQVQTEPEQSLCTHRVALFLVPLFVVAGNADIRDTELLLHFTGRWHSKAWGHKALRSRHKRTSRIQLALPHPGSELQGRKEKSPFFFFQEVDLLFLSQAQWAIIVRPKMMSFSNKRLVFKF